MTRAPSDPSASPPAAPRAAPRAAPSAEGTSALPRGRLWMAAALALAAVLAYLRTLSAGFVYDDLVLVQDNPNVASLAAALRAFFEPLWAFQDPTAEFQNAFWRPLTVLVIALGRGLSGFEAWGYHALSVLLHAAATLAAWRLARRLLGSARLAFAAGLVFALHPVHVESVAWISAVNDPLYGLFALLALDAHLAWRQRGSPGIPVAAGVWFLAALLCKEQALAVLPIALVLDLALGHLDLGGVRAADAPAGDEEQPDPFADLLRAYGHLLVGLGLYYVGRVVTYGSLLAGFDQVAAGFALTLGRSLQFRVEMLGRFLELVVAPVDQAVFRQVRPELPAGHGPWLRALFMVGLWVAGTLLAWRARWRLALAMLLALPASLSLLLVRYEGAGAFPISDRYLYVPALFAAVLAAALLRRALPERAVAGVLVALALVGGARTWGYTRSFQDDESFFRAAVAAEPDSVYAHWGMGRVLLQKYERTRERDHLDEAAFHYLTSQRLGTRYPREPELGSEASFAERAAELNQIITGTPPGAREPDHTVMWTPDDRLQANVGLGWCTLFRALDSPEADFDWPRVIFEQTVATWPEDFHARTGLGTVKMEMGLLEEAEAELRKAVQLNPAHAPAWHNLGQCLARQQRWDEARASFEQALRFRPDDLEDLLAAASAAIDGRRFEIAEQHVERAARAHPRSVEPVYLRGMLAGARGDLTAALARFDEVLTRLPDHPDAQLQRGKILAQQGEYEAASEALGRACELMPRSFEAYYHMAALLLGTPGGERAGLPYLTRAYALSPPHSVRQVLHVELLERLGQDLGQVLGLARLDLGRRDPVHALSWTERAIELAMADTATTAAQFAELQAQRGSLLIDLERHEEAAEAYRACLQSAPDSLRGHHDLASLLAYDLQRPAEALPHARRALELLDADPERVIPEMRQAMRDFLQDIVTLGEAAAQGPTLPGGDGDGDGR